MERIGNGWGKPNNLGGPVNTKEGEYFPSVTRDGTLYFTRSTGRQNLIYRSRLKEGKYTEPEKLPKQVNCGTAQYNAFIAPDESYIIVPTVGRKDSLGGTDYYIVFRNKDDTWNEPINMGEKINTPGTREYSASLSPDGKYLFFMSSRTLTKEKLPAKLTYCFLKEIYNKPQNGNSDIYWVDAKIIEDLRPR
jgi:Tol biopolymer transport system component